MSSREDQEKGRDSLPLPRWRPKLLCPLKGDQVEIVGFVDSVRGTNRDQEPLASQFAHAVVEIFGELLEEMHSRDWLILFELNDRPMSHQDLSGSLETVQLMALDIDLYEVEAGNLRSKGIEMNDFGPLDNMLHRG